MNQTRKKETHTQAGNSSEALRPLIYIHGLIHKHQQWLSDLQTQGYGLYARTQGLDSSLHELVTKTRHGMDEFSLLVDELNTHAGDRPLLFLKAGLEINPHQIHSLCQLISASDQALAATALSNALPEINPFADLDWQNKPSGSDCEQLVTLLGDGMAHRHRAWHSHCLLLSKQASEVLAASDKAPPLAALEEAGGALLISDTLFVHDPDTPLDTSIQLEPHETRRPPAWSGLAARLLRWKAMPLDSFTAPGHKNQPVTLHITHSWGGGVSQWVNAYIESSQNEYHLQLKSLEPQSGQGFGQALGLYLGSDDQALIRQWWLQPAISSTDIDHPQYAEILAFICDRYGVDRVIVSSLVGHALNALASKLPTLQVLHDYYPSWPLLSVHPQTYIKPEGGANLTLALQENTKKMEFFDKSVTGWEQLRQAYQKSLNNHQILLTAPSQSVINTLQQLDSYWQDKDIHLVPHGFPPFSADQPTPVPVKPKPREDGKLKVLVLGRIQPGKGQQLLESIIPQLRDHYQFYLLGTGKNGEVFFGEHGSNILLQYDRQALPEILEGIGPDLALLPSLVPETFSYTLSELQVLGIPVVASSVGSLAERIESGVTGWLVKPEPEDMVRQLNILSRDPQLIESVRKELRRFRHTSMDAMLDHYHTLLPITSDSKKERSNLPSLAHSQATANAYQAQCWKFQAKHAKQQVRELNKEVDKRTRWALSLDESLQQTQINLKEEAKKAAHLGFELQDKENILADRELELRQTSQQLEDISQQHHQLDYEHQRVLASSSWKITRPLRVLRRVLKNLKDARAYNPLRWPYLLSRALHNLKVHGGSGTIHRLQASGQGSEEPDSPSLVADLEDIGNLAPPATMPEHKDPLVSIVIPVYNKWAYTAACLRSLVECKTTVSFEVIVVDDQSSDETDKQLQQIKNLITLRNEKNLGFIGSCNRGAEQASGQYLVMLNNDTQVLDHWLDHLLDALKHYPDAGMVGARLIYPDGSLQEAGGMIFSDGSGWNYGRGDDANKPEYQYTREVDYCSGACLMLERNLYHQLGGFDSLYAPAYYEDTDLAFKVRQQDLKVVVAPQAVVVHHEGISSGTDITTGTKRYQEINKSKFLERWAEVLEQHPQPISDPDNLSEIHRARDHRLKGQVLVIDAYTPEPDQDSGSLRMTHLLNCLRDMGYGVSFFADNQSHAGEYTRKLQSSGIQALYQPWLNSSSTYFREHGAELDCVILSRHYIASNYIRRIKEHCPNAKIIFDTVDLHYLREERLAELEDSLTLRRVAEQTKRAEFSIIRQSDATLVVSPVEQEVLSKELPDSRIRILSNIHPLHGRRVTYEQRKDIFFVGGFQHPPNVDAMHWFVNDIWPLIHQEMPEVTFHLIGSKAPDSIRKLSADGVTVHGFVDDITPYLDNCRLAVAPLRYGAGVKGKVNMSMSYGQPVVATPMASEGMYARHGEQLLIADNAQAFAESVIRLYRDEALWTSLSDAGLENVKQHFSFQSAVDHLHNLLTELQQPSEGIKQVSG